MDQEGRPRPTGTVRVRQTLKLRMSRILTRKKRQIPQQEFSSVWQIVGLVQDEVWFNTEGINPAFVFLYVLNVSETGLDPQHSAESAVHVLAVRPPISQCPSPAERHRIGTNLRDYLSSQLAASPLVKHFIVVFKEQRLWAKRRSKHSSFLGRGQYVAMINTASQVNGVTPLEVRLVQELQARQRLTASSSSQAPAAHSASASSRPWHSADASHLTPIQQIHGTVSANQLPLTTPPPSQLQPITSRVGSMRRGIPSSVASNLNA